ncbi:Prophage integrase IntA [Saezia sanguinis]|uniref:Prophage integrase IntA n=1 Tax=Saezia sanguinis TaxID=1965230 RepID=A0A433SGD0_9BURK|nr:site-specific integrase [Saezia sanguinis]RUS67795.1 Prophage integrase IntA [Saezia sanguinis]
MATVTAKTIENAKPKAKQYKLQADAGLILWVYPTGLKRWASRFTINGEQRQATLPRPYGITGDGDMSLAEARLENERIQKLAKSGIDFREADLTQKQEAATQEAINNKIFKNMFDEWIENGVSRKDDNAELKRTFEKDVLPAIGKKRVKDVTETDLRNLLKKIIKERNANRMAVVIYKDIVQLFKWAEDRQPWRKLLAEGNPSKLINIKYIISPDYGNIYGERLRYLSDDELRELRDKFAAIENEYLNAPFKEKCVLPSPISKEGELAVWICLSTLCRIGELLMAEWKHVNFNTGEWLIPKQNVKSTRGQKQDHLVFLSPFALKQFKALYMLTGKSQWCFPNDNQTNHLYVKSVTKSIKDRQVMFSERKSEGRKSNNSLVLSDGVNGKWTPHDMRRTGATNMQKLKIEAHVIDRCQNHVTDSGNKIRKVYQLYDFADEKKEAWEKWGARLEEILCSPDSR